MPYGGMAPGGGMTLRALRPSSDSAASANGLVRPSAMSASSFAPEPPGALFLPSPERVMLSLRSFDTPRAAAAAVVPLGPRSLLVLLPLLRFRDLMTSVLSEMGRGRPFILKKRAQALQRMWVLSCERRHSGVVCDAIESKSARQSPGGARSAIEMRQSTTS